MTRAVQNILDLMATSEGQDIFEAFEKQPNRAWDAGFRQYGSQRISGSLPSPMINENARDYGAGYGSRIEESSDDSYGTASVE